MYPAAPQDLDRLLSTLEVADLLGLQPETLTKWRHLRTGPKYVKVGSNVRYRPDDIRTWVDAREVETR